jgi:hypothetical protein
MRTTILITEEVSANSCRTSDEDLNIQVKLVNLSVIPADRKLIRSHYRT